MFPSYLPHPKGAKMSSDIGFTSIVVSSGMPRPSYAPDGAPPICPISDISCGGTSASTSSRWSAHTDDAVRICEWVSRSRGVNAGLTPFRAPASSGLIFGFASAKASVLH